jgi:hypothetical protein
MKILHNVYVSVKPLSTAGVTNAVNAVVLENVRHSNVRQPSASSNRLASIVECSTRMSKPSIFVPGYATGGSNVETMTILSCVTKVPAEVVRRLYLKTSPAAVVELSSRLLYLAELSYRRAVFPAVGRKRVVIPKSLTVVMGRTRSARNAHS